MSLVERIADIFEESWMHPGETRTEWAMTVLETVLEALGYVTCQTCDGDGRELDDVSAAALARAIGVEAVVNDPCPDCVAGVQPSDEMIERGKIPVLALLATSWSEAGLGSFDELAKRDDFNEIVETVTNAALLAALPGGTE